MAHSRTKREAPTDADSQGRETDSPTHAPSENTTTSQTQKSLKRKQSKSTIDWNAVEQTKRFQNGFRVRYLKPKQPNGHASKKRKLSTNGDSHYADEEDTSFQRPPFKGTSFGETEYRVEPNDLWLAASRYRKFTIQDCSFCVDDFVYIKANEQEDPDPNAPIQGWVGKVLEVRAGNESHVYLRIYWMYRPEDLPGGRQPYHAKKELIASNDMMVIDAQAVDGKASVAHWVEDKDLTVLSEHQLLWRQTFDIRSPRKVLSELPKHCIDQKPCNPDELLIQCDSCEKWLHGPCLEQEAVRGAYKTHNIPFPGEEVAVTTSQNTPNSSKRRAKSAASPADSSTPAKRRRPRKSDILKEQSLEPSNLLFSAELQVKDGESVVMMVTDQRPGQKKKKSQVPVNCLLCGELIEGKSTEQSEDAEPTATSSSSILVTNPVTPKNKEEEEEEDSVLGDTDSERQAKQHISPTTLGINGAPSAPSAPSDEASSFNRADTGDGSDSTALERAEKTEEPHTSTSRTGTPSRLLASVGMQSISTLFKNRSL